MSSYRPPDATALDWLGKIAGGEVGAHARLRGGITAAVDRVVLVAGGERRDVVLKRWVQGDGPAEDLVRRECAALQALENSSVPAPEVIGFDATGRDAGVPCLAMSVVPGEPMLDADRIRSRLGSLATMHAAIHSQPAELTSAADGWFDPEDELRWIADRGLRDAVLASVAAPGRQPVFAHGDFQPFNVLWGGDAITGVVDWTSAGVGPRGIDVGHCRLNLSVLLDPDAADAYLQAYERAAGVRVDPGSDLRGLLHYGDDWTDFIPVQLAGRAAIDLGGMTGRVTETIRRTLDRFT